MCEKKYEERLTVHSINGLWKNSFQIDLTAIELFDITVLKRGRRSLSTRIDILKLSLDCTGFSDSALVNEVHVLR